MLNTFQAVGRLTRDPEYRQMQNGGGTCRATLAVDRNYRDRDGNTPTDFIELEAWDNGNRTTASNFANWLRKGYLVAVTGRIETGTYENQQGQKVHTTRVNVASFDNLTPRNQNQGGYQQPQQAAQPQQPNNYAQPQQSAPQAATRPQQAPVDPFASAAPDPFANNGKQIDIDDSDLPF
jgi:single-strand DNA-binding protein